MLGLPPFWGDFSQWTLFKEVFICRVINDSWIIPVEKLFHLGALLEGTPKQIIAGFPARGDQFTLAWELLVNEYDNLRNVVQHQLEILIKPPERPLQTATALKQFCAALMESTKTLIALGSKEELWEWIVVYQAVQHLDKTTRDMWETSLGNHPLFQRLKLFVSSLVLVLIHLSRLRRRIMQSNLVAELQLILEPNNPSSHLPTTAIAARRGTLLWSVHSSGNSPLRSVNTSSHWRNYAADAWAGTIPTLATTKNFASTAPRRGHTSLHALRQVHNEVKQA